MANFEVLFVSTGYDAISGEECGGSTEYILEFKTKQAAVKKALAFSKQKGCYEAHIRKLVDDDIVDHWIYKNGKYIYGMF